MKQAKERREIMSQYLIIYILGVLFGGIVVKLLHLKKRCGNIIVKQDEDGTYLQLQIKELSDITSNKEITLGIITQK